MNTAPAHDEQKLASPAFLASLRPPPLPLWAQPHASTALTASRLSLGLAHTLTQTGFQIARTSTHFGFSVARTLIGPVITGVGTVLDHSLGLDGITGGIGRGPVVQSLKGLIDVSEVLAMLGIGIGSEITKATLDTASSTVASLEAVYGNDEALRALAAFGRLVQIEYTTSLPSDPYPDGGLGRWSSIQVLKAAATWAALQSVTGKVYGQRVAEHLEELDIDSWGKGREVDGSNSERGEVLWEVTEEQVLEGGEEIIEASISGSISGEAAVQSEDQNVREHLKKFSKLGMGVYGGMGVIFFGVKLPTFDPVNPSTTPLTSTALRSLSRLEDEIAVAKSFESSTATTIPTSESDGVADALGSSESKWVDLDPPVQNLDEESAPPPKPLGFWALLSGSHDVTVLETLGGLLPGSTHPPHVEVDDDGVEAEGSSKKKGRRPPRFFVVTDHPNQSIVLCIRGTLSIDDVATDLACETAPFDSTLHWDSPTSQSSTTFPGEGNSGTVFQVHGGMFEIALAMGSAGGAVTRAVAKALNASPSYRLFLVGHSLGAGVASLLGVMWSNPDSCLTSSKSGLPAGRSVKVYGFAPPCTTDAELSWRCKDLILSFVYSTDAVSRFSLGHIKDIRSAASWLCFANENPEESCNNILSRIISYKSGRLDSNRSEKFEQETWFASLRTTLEANMHYAHLFPPGQVLWLTRPDDLELPQDEGQGGKAPVRPRLFKVTGRVDVVFEQMLFTQAMLSSHLPNQYMHTIQDNF